MWPSLHAASESAVHMEGNDRSSTTEAGRGFATDEQNASVLRRAPRDVARAVPLGLDSRKEGERPSEPGSLNGLNHAGGADLDPQLAGSNS